MNLSLAIIILLLFLYLFFKNIRKKKEHFVISSNTNYIKEKAIIYKDLLKRVSNVFTKLKIPFFLSSGTCLGFFREGKFLDHDYDIDVGVMKSDFVADIITEMRKEGFNYYRRLGKLSDGVEYSFHFPNTKIGRKAKVDIFVHYPEVIIKNGIKKKHIYWVSYMYPTFKKKVKYRVSHFNLLKTKFQDIDVWIPNPTLKYIEEHYGKDWRTPKRAGIDYFYATTPNSIVKN